MGYLNNLYKIFRGTTAGDTTGTPARSAALGLNENWDKVDNALEAINNASEKSINKAIDLTNPNQTSYPTTQAVKTYADSKDGLANQYTDAQLASYQAKSEKGAAGGYAPLDANTKVPATYLPVFVEEIVEGVYVNNTTFEDNTATPVTLTTGKIYLDTTTSFAYRYGGSVLAQIVSSPGSTDVVTEGSTNKYFTEDRVRATILTGISFVSSAVITGADSIITAFGKLQKQVSDLLTAVGTKLDKGTYTGTAQDLYDFANTKETTSGAQSKADAAEQAAKDYYDGLAANIRLSNVVTDLTEAEKTAIKTKLGVTDSVGASEQYVIDGDAATLNSANNYTNQKVTDNENWRGTFLTLAALQTAIPTGQLGWSADVDAGAGANVKRYIWDAQEGWVAQSGEIAGETAASIKTKYESNADTNAFTDALLNKLNSITEIFTTALKNSYDSAASWVSTNGANVLSRLTALEGAGIPTEEQIIGTATEGDLIGAVNLSLTAFSARKAVLTGNTTITFTNTPAAGKTVAKTLAINSTTTQTLAFAGTPKIIGEYKADGTINYIQVTVSNYPTSGLRTVIYINQ